MLAEKQTRYWRIIYIYCQDKSFKIFSHCFPPPHSKRSSELVQLFLQPCGIFWFKVFEYQPLHFGNTAEGQRWM